MRPTAKARWAAGWTAAFAFGHSYLADFFFLAFFDFFTADFLPEAFFFFFAAFMLSTRLGYLRPALLAAFFAFAFLAGVSFLDFLPAFFLGLGLSHGAFFDFFAFFATAIPLSKNCNERIEPEFRLARAASQVTNAIR